MNQSRWKYQAFKSLALIAFMCITCGSIHASVTRMTASSGDWNDASTWTPAGIPDATDNITIAAGHSVIINDAAFVQTLTVSSGASLAWSTADTLTLAGAFTVNGIVTMNDGNIIQSVNGSAFVLGAGSTFTWQPGNNTAGGATLFTGSTENFSSSSNLIITKWYSYSTPIGSVVTGNFGNLTLNSLNSSNLIVEWNQNNYFQSHQVTGTLTIDQGWITLDKSGSISNTTVGSVYLLSVNSSLYIHNGTHPSSFTFTTNTVTNDGGTFYGLNDGDGNVTIQVNGNFTNIGNVKIINNSGVANVSNGNAVFNVNGTFSQTTGDTRFIYNVTTLNSGIYTSTIGSLQLNGGIFMGQTACHTAAGTSTLSVTGNFAVSFSGNTDKFRGVSLSSIGATLNNVKFKLNVGGNLSIAGIAASEFTSSAGSGGETTTITGDVVISGSSVNFNYGTTSASHTTITSIGGNLITGGGTTYLSRNGKMATITVSGNLNLGSGNLSLKGDTGISTMTVTGSYTQTGGNFYLHNNTTSYTTGEIDVTISGAFSQSGGIINFDNNTSSLSATHQLFIAGSTYSISGSGLITHALAGSGSVFGKLNFSRNGTIAFSRTSNSHLTQQVKQTVMNGCTVDIATGNIQLSSHAAAGTDYFRIATGGIVNSRNGQLVSGGAYTNCGLQVDSGGTLKTFNTNGLYDGTSSACISSSYNLNYYLDANSIVEYNGVNNQVITGTGSGVATTADHKYGILRINFSGADDAEYVYIGPSSVFVRTGLEMIHGELNLNGHALTIESGNTTAITRTGGYIKSESNLAFNTSTISWQNMTSGLHQFPFGVNSSSFIPVSFTPTAGFGGTVSISTRATQASDNMPFTTGVLTSVAAGLNVNGSEISTEDVVDRWWDISAPGFTADVEVCYRKEENTLMAGYNTSMLNIIQWNGTGWEEPIGYGTGTISGIGKVSATGVTLFSSWLVTKGISVLPIGLVDFTARKEDQHVMLEWETASEQNNDFFTIERSRDKRNYSALHTVNGAGNSNSSLKYSYADMDPLDGTSYYRLKQTDFDGHFSYSPVRSVNMIDNPDGAIAISDFGPNPFDKNFWVKYKTTGKGSAVFRFANTEGRVFFTETREVQDGINLFEYPGKEELRNGVYLLSITYHDKTITQKFFKQ